MWIPIWIWISHYFVGCWELGERKSESENEDDNTESWKYTTDDGVRGVESAKDIVNLLCVCVVLFMWWVFGTCSYHLLIFTLFAANNFSVFAYSGPPRSTFFIVYLHALCSICCWLREMCMKFDDSVKCPVILHFIFLKMKMHTV